ncbi:MAG TPA: hypothetical protein VKI65_09920 [Gemmataceae bacterium]|nr:hypothetical protein [Gemmataceae bacterium]
MPTPFAPRVAGAPRAPVSSSKAGLIYWPAVAAACVLSLFLMAAFAGLAWIAGRAAGTPMTAEPVRVTVEIAQPPSSNSQEARAVVQASGQTHQPVDGPPQPVLGSEKLGTEMPAVPEPQTVARAGASPAGFGETVAELTPEPGVPVKCETFGTRVQFVRNPSEAVRLAGRDRKLVFLPQISGNFEDQRFT